MASVFKRGGKANRHGYYSVAWVDHTGKRRTKSTRTTDKSAAERIAAKLDADAALRREGVVDPTLDAIGKQSQRSIESHLDDYESKLRAAGRTVHHILQTTRYIREFTSVAGWRTVADIAADAVNRFANGLQEKNKSARTVQAYLTAIKGFSKWLAQHNKLPRDPLISVKKPNPQADRRRERRAISPEEWRWQEAAMLNSPERYGITADERLTLYRTAIQTGLRSNELRSLTRGNLYLGATQPYVTCKAGSTKNRKDARQYIQPELADELHELVAIKAPKAPVFNLPHESNMARMLRDDLAEARREWLVDAKGNPEERIRREQSDFLKATNHEGELVDFHCLRHTCGAWLAMSGAHPKVIQTVMRHSTITLTMDTYGHLFPGQEAEAVGRMREMLSREAPEAMRATGTDDAQAADGTIERSARRSAQGATLCVAGASPCDNDSLASGDRMGKTPEEIGARSNSPPSVTMPSDQSAPLAQLAEQLTLNQ